MSRHPASKNMLALLATCLGALMFGLEITSVPVILPSLERVLHGDFQGLQWVMNAYTLACTTVLMATGTLADRFGRKPVILAGLLIFAAGSFWAAAASDIYGVLAGRALQGAGAISAAVTGCL